MKEVSPLTTKILTALTYAETNVPNESGEDFPNDVGTLFNFPLNYSVVGQRLALLLYDNNVKLFEQEKITIVFSTYLDIGEISDNGRLSNDGSRYITVGVSPVDFNAVTRDARISKMLDVTKDVLLSFDTDDEFGDVIKTSIERVKEEGEDIELTYQRKSDQKVSVDLTLRLYDSGQCQIYSTIKNNHGDVLRHDHIEDAHCLSVALQKCGSILIRKNKIIIKPQKNILSKGLQPIEIEYSL